MTEREEATAIVVLDAEAPQRPEVIETPDDTPKVGQWYWVRPGPSGPAQKGVVGPELGPQRFIDEEEEEDDGAEAAEEAVHGDEDGESDDAPNPKPGEPWLGCVAKLGSNYALLSKAGVSGDDSVTERIHFDVFHTRCFVAHDPDTYIAEQIATHEKESARLMRRVHEITAALGVGPTAGMLGSGAETAALATVNASDGNFETYTASLVKAKKELLPDLFKRIEHETSAMAGWMRAKLIPLQATASSLHSKIGAIEDRIFSVELYAGLTERVEQIADGEPAPMGTKIHLMQRRCYMDEECLAQYEAGGMDYKNIEDFDRWLVRPANLERLLPFPRCAVAFRVRRFNREREANSLWEFLKIMQKEDADRWTFLYLRNGERVYRLRTAIDFSEELFPDEERSRLHDAAIYGKVGQGGTLYGVLSKDEVDGIFEEHRAEVAKWKNDKSKSRGWRPRIYEHFVPYDRDTVLYDDITERLNKTAKEHNRVALVLQGLLDRSPVFHPHPPWRLWTDAGFATALELIYDATRALAPKNKPDFEAYRRKLNAKIVPGTVTFGQERAWYAWDGINEHRGWRHGEHERRKWDDPGPGKFARVESVSHKKGTVTFAWLRPRAYSRRFEDEGKDPNVRATFTCALDKVINVDAYQLGDFKRFFEDPRTRLNYVKWAPFLLSAENYKGGHGEEPQAPAAPKKRAPASWSAKRRYASQKRAKALLDKVVRLTEDIETTDGNVYKAGSFWEVTGTRSYGRQLYLAPLRADGTRVFGGVRRLGGIDVDDIEVVRGMVAKSPPKAPEDEDPSELEDPDDDTEPEEDTDDE